MTELVDRMRSDGASTAPLDEFIAAYEQDDNLWWVIACGHHQNLFEAAIDRMQAAEAKLAAIRDQHYEIPGGWCNFDGFSYPCATVRILDGGGT